MDLRRLANFVERLRRETIGAPKHVPFEDHHVFEYEEESVKVVAVLKLVRAAHGVSAMNILLAKGLFIDFGASARGVYDSVAEIYFLLENYPRCSANVEQFVNAFFETTLSGYRDAKIPPIPTKKIRAAATRALLGKHDDVYRGAIDRVFQAFSGYVHANYSHIMEVYYQPGDSFNLLGVPDIEPVLSRSEHIYQAGVNVLHAGWFIARTFGLDALRTEIWAFCEEEERRMGH